MNYLDNETRKTAGREAVFCVYSYLIEKAPPEEGELFGSAADRLWRAVLSPNDEQKLAVIEGALGSDPALSLYTVGDIVTSGTLNVCTFTSPAGEVSVVFRGTGRDEWADNADGLSGIAMKNTFFTYDKNGNVASKRTAVDYSTPQQVAALNRFNRMCAVHGWTHDSHITVSGHSKGGNKAQYITMHSDTVRVCLSFDGQGFSPEAVEHTRAVMGEKYEIRRQRIKSLSAYNDFVSVLGEQMCPPDSIFYFDAPAGAWNPVAYHYPESILDENGNLREEREAGDLSRFIRSVSDDLGSVPPRLRRHAVHTVTDITARLLGIR